MKAAIVIPNWNGADFIAESLRSLQAQSYPCEIVVVDNGSVDESKTIIKNSFPGVTLIELPSNTGFAGGVNTGIRYALDNSFDAAALFNNDAVADKDWLKHLVTMLQANLSAGIATCKLLSADKTHIDSTGDYYTTWGLPYPRGRGEKASAAYDDSPEVFGASGGASLYRATMLREIGLFDEDFFAYYEDVDISFRAQLAGWKVIYVPEAEAYHQQGITSGRLKGFTTYHTFKNYPLLFWKNVPWQLVPRMLPRFILAYLSISVSSLLGGRGWPALKGFLMSLLLLPKKLLERHRIQKSRKVSAEYINSILVHDLPPNATKLHKLRSFFTKNS